MPGWNTSAVTDMSNAFSKKPTAAGMGPRDKFNVDIGGWDTSSVTTMSYMFLHAGAFNQPIGAWNTASVTTMKYMFYGASTFDQPLATWRQGLTLDRLTAQLEPCLSRENTLHALNTS